MIKPIVALTLGDPAGIGPEIVLKALLNKSLVARYRLVVVGDAFVLKASHRGHASDFDLPSLCLPKEIRRSQSFPCLLNCGHGEFKIPRGRIDRRCGLLSLHYLQTAVHLALNGFVDGIVTAPIHKQSWAAAGAKAPGHTELLAQWSRTKQFAMAFYTKDFLTVLLTTHLPLKKAIAALSSRLLREKIRLTHQSLKGLGRQRIRIAVAGVNPHAGEGGLLGEEERRIFLPAIRRCRKEGLDVSGPYPADTLYLRAAQGEFDAVVAPYHDQAMLAVKTLSFGHATNITLGLPFVRTSVDHGTAFDIAGQGVANESAMVGAIERCGEWILARKKSMSQIKAKKIF